MAITVFEACRKRKRTPKNIFSTTHFSSSTADDSTTRMDLSRSFRDNIREFLKRCAEVEDYKLGTNLVWCTLLVNESSGVVFPLYIIEEIVPLAHSSSSSSSSSHQHQSLCDFCRFVGWSHHFVSKRNYHLIIPDEEKWNKPLKKDSIKHHQNHLIHGVIHCNGFGHLLSIKIESNSSNYLNGEELMNLWDHLCSTLRTRDISVHDLSKKGTMELRLLYGVAYGRSWFGKWDYKLCRGNFGLQKQDYFRAIEILYSLELSKIISDSAKRKQGKLIEQIVQTYNDVSETHLITLSDLLNFMLSFESKTLIQRKTALALASAVSLSKSLMDTSTHQPKTAASRSYPNECRSLAAFVAKLDGRWPKRRFEQVVNVIFQILETNGARMLRQDLRDAVRQHIGDTGLIDFVLKHIDKVIVGNQVIFRANEPGSKLLEFSLEDVSDGATIYEKKIQSHTDIPSVKPGQNVYKDLLYLYKNVFLGYPEYHAVAIAVRVILDCKHFVKEWQFKSNDEDASLRLICQVRPSFDELVNELTRPLPPGELVIAPECATVGELKLTVECALRDTYCVMDKFMVKDIQIGELMAREDQDLLKCGVEQDMQVWVRGYGLDLETKLRYQGGDNDWTVDCKCGAKDDDGERMVACDSCHVWQHTRCNSIKDGASPPLFLCRMCSSRMKKLASRCISSEKNKSGNTGPQ